MPADFEWKRYWCPRDKSFDLSDGGFLSDPESEGKFKNPNLVTFDEVSVKRCLILLGEPGIGKSRDLERQAISIEKFIQGASEKLLRLDLRSFGSEDRLINALFKSVEFEEWRNGNYVLHLYLDSLDECLLRIDNVASLLADELPRQPVDRLQLRIVCRTVPWPVVLERALLDLFGDDNVGVYEMVPLRRSDVRIAAEQKGIDPDAFLQRIEALAVTALAVKPVTLNFLMNTYLQEADLPTNQLDLYEKGCRILCEESNESRQGAGRVGRFTPEQRLAIASRIAAVTQLANRYAVWTGSEAGEMPEEDVFFADLIGNREYGPDEFVVSPESVRETLDTGLFSSRGQNRIGWAHQTYAEFLAARYCKCRELPVVQIRPLIFHPAYGGKRLVPQMHEVAAWISVMAADVLTIVANSDPEALLGAAAASLSYTQRDLVVSSILTLSESGRPLDLRWGMYRLYHKLKHPDLPTQLRAYLADPTKNLGPRRVAVDMAGACNVAELGADLAQLALNTSEDISLRIPAAAVAAAVGSTESRIRLRPLAFQQAGEDPDDELKGAGLSALWPDLISAEELFSLITSPKNPNLHGLYMSFVSNVLLGKMQTADLPIALEWFRRQECRVHIPGAFDRLMDGIVWLAWKHLDKPKVAESLASAIVSRAEIHDDLIGRMEAGRFYKELENNQEARRRLLESLLPRLSTLSSSGLYYATHYISRSDFDWLLQRVLRYQGPLSVSIEAKLILRVVDPMDSEQMKALWFACQSNATINNECKQLFGPIELDSEVARMLRSNLTHEEARRKPRLLVPSPSERIAENLLMIDRGETSTGWLQLIANLGLRPDSTAYSYDLEPDITEMPGWRSIDTSTAQRILAAAARYINEADPHNNDWFGTSNIPFLSLGGFQALVLLHKLAPERLYAFTIETWLKWVPSIIRYPVQDATVRRAIKSALLGRAYAVVPEEVIQASDSGD